MKININGEEQEYEQNELTISDLLKLSEVEMPEMVTVQLNRTFVDKKDYTNTKVSEDDEVDFLYFMGGGKQ